MKTLVLNRNVVVSIFAVILLLYGVQGISYAQDAPDTIVEFADANLARAVRKALGLPTGDGVDLLKIPKAELEKLTTLSAYTVEIEDLTGLEDATQLKELDLSYNDYIRDISPLAGLTNLTELDLQDNRIGDISPLAGLTNLITLYLNENDIRDISPLAGLTNLMTLYLDDNLIHDVTPLASLIYLEELSLANNPITDKSPLRVLLDESPRLKIDIVVAGPGPVVEFSDINLAKGVRWHLNLPYKGDEVDILKVPKPELAELKHLNLAHDRFVGWWRITNLKGLEHATRLITLSLTYNEISDITPLTN